MRVAARARVTSVMLRAMAQSGERSSRVIYDRCRRQLCRRYYAPRCLFCYTLMMTRVTRITLRLRCRDETDGSIEHVRESRPARCAAIDDILSSARTTPLNRICEHECCRGMPRGDAQRYSDADDAREAIRARAMMRLIGRRDARSARAARCCAAGARAL